MPERKVMQGNALINGAEGECYLKIDGEWKYFMSVKNLTATSTKNKEAYPILGRRSKGHKVTSTEYTGSFTSYFVTSLFTQKAYEYQQTGKDFIFDIQVINSDPGSGTGTQDVILKGCSCDTTELAKLDIEDSFLEFDVDFTFDEFSINSQFNTVEGVGTPAQ